MTTLAQRRLRLAHYHEGVRLGLVPPGHGGSLKRAADIYWAASCAIDPHFERRLGESLVGPLGLSRTSSLLKEYIPPWQWDSPLADRPRDPLAHVEITPNEVIEDQVIAHWEKRHEPLFLPSGSARRDRDRVAKRERDQGFMEEPVVPAPAQVVSKTATVSNPITYEGRLCDACGTTRRYTLSDKCCHCHMLKHVRTMKALTRPKPSRQPFAAWDSSLVDQQRDPLPQPSTLRGDERFIADEIAHWDRHIFFE
jgi:hypothetical protein